MKTFILICVIVLTVLIFFALLRAILGPRLADRILAINMIGTMIIAATALLSVYLGESSLLDISLIYAVISFVAVIVITKIYIGIYRERRESGEGGTV